MQGLSLLTAKGTLCWAFINKTGWKTASNFSLFLETFQIKYHTHCMSVSVLGPTGSVSFHRQVRQWIGINQLIPQALNEDEFPNWETCQHRLKDLLVRSDGTIEDDGIGMLQVDFSNSFIGGGVLGKGCVQEEIRYCRCYAN